MNRRALLLPAVILACSIGLASTLPDSAVNHGALSFSAQAAYAQEDITFEKVKEKGTPSSFEKFDIYTLIVEQDARTKKNQVVMYGEFKMPYTYQDIEIDDHDYNYLQITPEFKGFFELDPEHISGSKYDATIFKVNIQPFALDQDVSSLTLTIDNEEFTVKLPDKAALLYTKDLEDALQEHGSEYRNALSFGMRITTASDKAFQSLTKEAEALLEKAKLPDTTVTQDEINDIRTRYNEAFFLLKPEPFERTALKKSLERARTADEKQGVNNRRYEKEGYEAFSKLYQRALELMKQEDLTSIVGPREGEALPTHSEYESLPTKLDEAREALKLQDYTPVDMSLLQELYYQGLALTPAEHKTYTKASFEALYGALHDSLYTLIDPYATNESVAAMYTRLDEAIKSLTEEELDISNPFDLVIRYRHPLDDAPSAKIDDYFREKDQIIQAVMSGIFAGQIVRIYLDDTQLIKKFSGYTASSFFYASSDTSQDVVRVLRDKQGKQFIILRAQQNAGLDVKYLKAAVDTEFGKKPSVEYGSSSEGNPGITTTLTVQAAGGRKVEYTHKLLPKTGYAALRPAFVLAVFAAVVLSLACALSVAQKRSQCS